MNAALITNAPALAYVKEWNAWIVVNNKTEMISSTDDPAESIGSRYGARISLIE